LDQKEDNPTNAIRLPGNVPAADLAEMLCHHLSLDQQVLLRLVGRSVSGELSDGQLVALLRSFSLELPRRKREVIQAIASEIDSGGSFTNALSKVNSRKFRKSGNFVLMEKAIEAAEAQTSLPEFFSAVSEYQPSRRPLALRYQDTMRKKLIRLAFKSFVILQLVVFILLFIVPEFQKMYAEFGIELPDSMMFFMIISDRIAHWWFVFPFLFLVYLIIFRRPFHPHTWLDLKRRVFAKFSSWDWLQRPLSKRQRRKLLFAFSNMQSDENRKVRPKLKRREKAALKVAHSEDVKLWLMGRSVREENQRNTLRQNRFGDGFIVVWNLVLACIVATVAFGIMSSLITIIEAFSG